MTSLEDRVAVVTGAAGGIGSAIAMALARAGAHLVLVDLDEARLSTVAEEVRALGRRCTVARADVRSVHDMQAVLARSLEDHGGCHVVVNNAGVLHAAPLLDADYEQWRRVMDVNLWGVLNGSRVFGQHFVAQGDGHIVNVASAAGVLPAPGMTLYGASKAEVISFTRQLRWELSPEGVGVSLVIPGAERGPNVQPLTREASRMWIFGVRRRESAGAADCASSE